jgi:antitoxin VapB
VELFPKNGCAVNLHIKNAEAYRLARAIADATGETLTHAVIEALRERYVELQRRKAKGSVEEILSIASRVSAHLKRPNVSHGELLYDQNGLPK